MFIDDDDDNTEPTIYASQQDNFAVEQHTRKTKHKHTTRERETRERDEKLNSR